MKPIATALLVAAFVAAHAAPSGAQIADARFIIDGVACAPSGVGAAALIVGEDGAAECASPDEEFGAVEEPAAEAPGRRTVISRKPRGVQLAAGAAVAAAGLFLAFHPTTGCEFPGHGPTMRLGPIETAHACYEVLENGRSVAAGIHTGGVSPWSGELVPPARTLWVPAWRRWAGFGAAAAGVLTAIWPGAPVDVSAGARGSVSLSKTVAW